MIFLKSRLNLSLTSSSLCCCCSLCWCRCCNRCSRIFLFPSFPRFSVDSTHLSRLGVCSSRKLAWTSRRPPSNVLLAVLTRSYRGQDGSAPSSFVAQSWWTWTSDWTATDEPIIVKTFWILTPSIETSSRFSFPSGTPSNTRSHSLAFRSIITLYPQEAVVVSL